MTRVRGTGVVIVLAGGAVALVLMAMLGWTLQLLDEVDTLRHQAVQRERTIAAMATTTTTTTTTDARTTTRHRDGKEDDDRGLLSDDYKKLQEELRETKGRLQAALAAKDQNRTRLWEQGKRFADYPPIRRPFFPGVQLDAKALRMCSRCFFNTYFTTTKFLDNGETFVFTGDLDDMWIRDSAAQVHPYLFYVNEYEIFRRLIEGLIRKQAFFINFDPYANAYRIDTKYKFSEEQKDKYGRGGYVATRNYELDSGGYFLRLLWEFMKLKPKSEVIFDPEVKKACRTLVDLWILEQDHSKSPYIYSELPKDGKGTPTGYTGLTWSGFRASDDLQMYGYLVPANMFVSVQLGRLVLLSDEYWKDEELSWKARHLQHDIDQGIRNFGTVEHRKYGRIYAYEIDGLNNANLMDDANVPSLLSIPYLEYPYDPVIYENTRRFVLSPDNPYYFTGQLASGVGSPHTKRGYVWHMAIIMQGLTTNDTAEKQSMMDMLVRTDANLEMLHESFDPSQPRMYSRKWFAWTNALFAEFAMTLTDPRDCPNMDYVPDQTDRDVAKMYPNAQLPTLSPRLT